MKPLLILALTTLLMNTSRAQDWQLNVVAGGAKPSLALDSEGTPHIAYVFELSSGWVRHAVWNPGTMTFDTTTVNTGNFYGPAAIALDRNDIPGINYHRHTPVPEQIYSTLVGPTWVNTAIASDNHDGWDNSLQFDSNNLPRTSSVDPVDFGPASTGVEYALFDGVSWNVEAIGSAQILLAMGTSLELDAGDDPHITYYDSNTGDLMYATKQGGSWTIAPVETSGDVGRFSSLELDDLGRPRIAYYRHLADSVGLVKYAAWNGATWDISVVDTLRRVYLDEAHATISLDLDPQGQPHISYGDEKIVGYATLSGSSWIKETVVDVHPEATVLGQVTSIAVGPAGEIHIAYHELLTRVPLNGTVMHATKEAGTGIPCGDFTGFLARCVSGGTVQARATLLNSTIHAGKTVDFSVDGETFTATIVTNGTHSRAQISLAGYAGGNHTVELTDPSGCFPPTVVACATASGPLDREWELDDFTWAATNGMSVNGSSLRTGLTGNSPNPFNPSTTIHFSLGSVSRVTLKIYDVIGREITTLIDDTRPGGDHAAVWDGRDVSGRQVAGGVYLYALTADGMTMVGKVTLIK